MMLLKSFLYLLFLVSLSWEISDKCKESSTKLKEIEDCSNQEYASYTECMRRNRTKRELDCEQDDCEDCVENTGGSDCDDCNCNYCSYHDCSTNCNQCCSNQSPPCSSSQCCHKTCNTQCRSYDCRRRCKKTCQEKIISSPGRSDSNLKLSTNTSVRSLHNITTVINLHNIINNTNVIDMPVQVNNTNINNITIQTPNIELPSQQLTLRMPEPQIPSIPIETNRHLQQLPSPPLSPLSPQPQAPCCKIIEPRQCTPTTTFPFQKCFHLRRHHCGGLCTSNIMHAQPHQICDQDGGMQASCQQQVTYIPQPQPRCFATSSWPYVNCHLQGSAMTNCEGCYGNGYRDQASCSSSCFDQNMNTGPFMQPGLFYPPSFGFGNRGAMDYNGLNLFGGSSAFMGVPSDSQYGIVTDTGINKREYLSSDKVEMIREPIGRGYRSVEDLEHTLEKDEYFVSSKEKNIDSEDRRHMFKDD